MHVPSGIGDLTPSEIAATEFLMLLADRDSSVISHPAFHRTIGSGSNVIQVSHLGVGSNILSADTPGSEHSATEFTDGSTEITIANMVLRRSTHDLALMMANGKLDPTVMAMDAAIAVGQTMISLVANVGDGFTNVAGTSGANATWADVLQAKAFLGIAKAQGDIVAILHPQQWADLETDALSAGVVPAASGLADAVTAGLGLYKGRYFGIDFFVSSFVPTANAGANRAGCIFVRGGVLIGQGRYAPEADPNILDLGELARFERFRHGTSSATSYTTSAILGCSLGIDAAGVSLITDA